MTMNPVGWFEIYVEDMARARAFYEKVLDLSLSRLDVPEAPEGTPSPGGSTGPDMEMWAFPGDMTTVGASGALVRMAGVPPGGNSTIVYFRCEDCFNEEARVAGAGGRVHQSKMSIGPYGFVSMAIDTEGNMIGLHSML